ncbi:glycoside hydrolase family 3 C-terminal domain-containing protein [Quadrisphaera oryzae]|uniref:glycoside hydrolase family 3 C-terminal domain-containing protein n=1 Tax=Quadrisphaera TaxID=317661 RepID=UPI00164438E2|nr:glycoside hydrolase family 3 C-terminal domain-containing protein [Quadrisphaera sp. RL12-1S]MBC3760675.1 glycoside hydrolase family 3 C-terminal domain-containing protein [Quadrisphaera sp. RL12-1S]
MTTTDAGSAALDVETVLASLTLEERASLLDGSDFWHTQGLSGRGVPAVMVTDGPHGLRKQPADGDHLGLGGSVPATCFPPAAGLASSWDVDLLHRVGTALGEECRAEGVAVLLGPGVNMKRTPLCGRNFEYFSEDPVLAGDLAAALVRGVQSQGVGTSLKHFAANNQETHRMSVSAEVDERTLREVYLTAFERVVRTAQPWTVMCSYNRVNGVYASQDPWLLTQVLREEWGFEGLVVSDWGAVDDRPTGVAAGLDLEMPSSSGASTAKVLAAVREGRLSEEDVDRAARRVLELVAKAQPGLAEPRAYDAAAHHALAREAAQRSAVLLRNDPVSARGGKPLLPLDLTGPGVVAVVGEMARTPRYQGAGSSQVVPTQLDDALTALRAGLAGTDVRFAAGYPLEGSPVAGLSAADLTEEAVAAARAADVVLVFLGLPGSYESEGFDRTHLDLPAEQLALLDAVLAVNESVVVVLSNGSAVRLHPWADRVPALLEGWLLGQAGGSAVADLLLGVVSPSGKLAETLPLRLEDTPAFTGFPGEGGVVRYGEGVFIGYRWYDTREAPVSFPFGHGLTYTTFEHADLSVEVTGSGADAGLSVTLTVTNTGRHAAAEVVQAYVADPEASVARPDSELKAFARVELEPGQSRTVAFELDARALSYWSPVQRRWVVEGGAFEVRVGASSRDVRLRETVQVDGEDLTLPVAVDDEISTWLGHPVAGPALRAVLERSGGGFAGMVDDPTHGEMFRAIPLVRMARFPGFPATEDELAEIATRANA